jgi:small GTP-binding protein
MGSPWRMRSITSSTAPEGVFHLPTTEIDSAMLLTPRAAGGAAIAVVRVRGGGVGRFLDGHFSGRPGINQTSHGELRDGSSVIDDCLVVLGPDGNWADLCLHGGPWVIESTLHLLAREGFQIADPALPVPADSFDDDLDELEREVLQYLPLAVTEPAIRMLLAQPAAWRGAKEKRVDPATILNDQTLWRLLHPPKIAIIGEPNVGKSTLANRLFGRRRSITADEPGTTRDWVGEMADLGGLPVMLIDTPGVRETENAIEAAAIAASGDKIREADLLIVVLDASGRRPLSLPQNLEGRIVVINKIDRPSGWDFSAMDAIRISAKTGEGCAELCWAVHLRLGVSDLDANRARWWTERQRGVLGSGSSPRAGG